MLRKEIKNQLCYVPVLVSVHAVTLYVILYLVRYTTLYAMHPSVRMYTRLVCRMYVLCTPGGNDSET